MRKQLTYYFLVILIQIIGISSATIEQQLDHDFRSAAFQKRMTTAAFDILEHVLIVDDGSAMYPSDFDELRSALFVTWDKDGQQAGCVGTFDQNEKLGVNIARMAVAAANDDRYPRLTLEDMPRLKVKISLLSDFE